MNDCNMEMGPWGLWNNWDGGWLWFDRSGPMVLNSRELALAFGVELGMDDMLTVKPIEQADLEPITE